MTPTRRNQPREAASWYRKLNTGTHCETMKPRTIGKVAHAATTVVLAPNPLPCPEFPGRRVNPKAAAAATAMTPTSAAFSTNGPPERPSTTELNSKDPGG